METALVWGLFVRAWREDWAHLSRGQLSLALGARLGRPVRPHVVRAWEEGQAPATGEELQALLDLLADRGLVASELAAVRRAACGALVARQYASASCATEHVVELPDSEDPRAVVRGDPNSDTVRMLAEIRLLEDALAASAPRLSRRRTASLRRSLMARRARQAVDQQVTGRFERMESLSRLTAGMLRRHARGGLGWIASPAAMDVHAAFARVMRTDSPQALLALHGLIDASLAAGDTYAAVQAACWTVQFGERLPPPILERVLGRWEQWEELASRVDPTCHFVSPGWHLLGTHMSLADWPALEALVTTLRARMGASTDDYRLGLLQLARGTLELAEGRRGPAAVCFESALTVANQLQNLPLAEWATARLRACEA